MFVPLDFLGQLNAARCDTWVKRKTYEEIMFLLTGNWSNVFGTTSVTAWSCIIKFEPAGIFGAIADVISTGVNGPDRTAAV